MTGYVCIVRRPADDERLDTELAYAWGWFQHHAGQRLAAFNFFLTRCVSDQTLALRKRLVGEAVEPLVGVRVAGDDSDLPQESLHVFAGRLVAIVHDGD